MQYFKTVSAWLFYGGNVGSFYLLNLHYGIVWTVPKLILDGDTRIYSSMVYSVGVEIDWEKQFYPNACPSWIC